MFSKNKCETRSLMGNYGYVGHLRENLETWAVGWKATAFPFLGVRSQNNSGYNFAGELLIHCDRILISVESQGLMFEVYNDN